ncbi:SAP domain-containing ribonucleoprotein-like [Euwallacea fornicatus]|uniref:SAP domain-containing ribonucleoprotein-like n=1 Tax=Euwallacea fornicatus TaxID=995702 RepID=UPI00338DD056
MANDAAEDISPLTLNKLKVPDLKKELKNRGLSITGNKTELVERLLSALKAKAPEQKIISDPLIDDIEEEDLLNEDDDDEHLDERESVISDIDIDNLPKVEKRKLEVDKSSIASGPAKKVILKRNISETYAASAVAQEVKSEEDVPTGKSNIATDDKKVIKLSELSSKERLEMRAKKFGVTTLSDDAKKLARAERFGVGSNEKSTSGNSIKLNTPNTSIEVLKQRAARFGGSVSSLMSEVENKERQEKRRQRFGITTLTTTSTVNGKSVVKDLEAAKAARLERFKTEVK